MNEQLRFASEDDAEALLAIYAPYVADTVITYEYEVPSVSEFENALRPLLRNFLTLYMKWTGRSLAMPMGTPSVQELHSNGMWKRAIT